MLFYALSDPTRRQIVAMLNEGAHTVTSLAEPFKMSLAAISKHIKILEKAQLLNRQKLGRVHECTINPAAMKTAEEYVQFYTKFWNEKLNHFAADLEDESSERSGAF